MAGNTVLPHSVALLLGLAFGSIPVHSIAAERPNIVVLIADDLGYGELGCQGNPQIPTPHIDSIASNGVRFTDGYVTASYCSASRAGFMTGRYQTRFGYEFNPIGAHNDDPNVGMPLSQRTLAEMLRDAGYATGLVGKWHLGGAAPYHPLRHGFDEFFGFLHEGHFYVPPPYKGVTTMLRRKVLPNGGTGRWSETNLIYSTHMGHNEPPYDANNPILRDGQPVEEKSYLTDALAREAVDFIERRSAQPFFLCVAFNAVHSPLQAPDRLMTRFASLKDVQRRIFAGMLANMDEAVGAILGQLRDKKLEENTIVFFISDNGGPTRELTSSNAPLRGGKGDVYEGGIRVPFLAQWKGTLPSGKVYSHPVVSLDVFATAAALAGDAASDRNASDGRNLVPYLTGSNDKPPHDRLFWRMQSKTALRQGDWKLVKNPGWRRKEAQWELYNLAEDIEESKNLAAAMSEKAEALQREWERINAQMADPFWSPSQAPVAR